MCPRRAHTLYEQLAKIEFKVTLPQRNGERRSESLAAADRKPPEKIGSSEADARERLLRVDC